MKIILIVALICSLANSSQFPKILWGYWQSGLQTDLIIQNFHKHHEKVLQGWQVIVLDNVTVYDYLRKIPYYKNDMDNYYMELPHKADFIRCYLLSYYGGVWMDISSILIQNFQWLLMENLRNNPDVLNKYGDEANIVGFTFNQVTKQTHFDKQTQKQYQVTPALESWFFAAKPGTLFFRQLIQLFTEGLANGMYLHNNNYVNDLVDRQKILVGHIKNIQYLGFLKLICVLTQRKQRQLDAISQRNNQPRVMATWHYKIWHIRSQNGPLYSLIRWSVGQIEILSKYSKKQIEQSTGRKYRYFTKLVGASRKILVNYLYGSEKRPETFKQTIKKIARLQPYEVQYFFCPDQMIVHPESFLNTILLHDNPNHINTQFKSPESLNITALKCQPLRQFMKRVREHFELEHWGGYEYTLDGSWKAVSKEHFIIVVLYLVAVLIIVVNLAAIVWRWRKPARGMSAVEIHQKQTIQDINKPYQSTEYGAKKIPEYANSPSRQSQTSKLSLSGANLESESQSLSKINRNQKADANMECRLG